MRTPRRLVHGQPPSLNEAMKGLRCLASFRSHHPPKPNPWWWWRVQTIRKKPESLCLKPLKWENLRSKSSLLTKILKQRSSVDTLTLAWLWVAWRLWAEAPPAVERSPSKSARHERTVTNPTLICIGNIVLLTFCCKAKGAETPILVHLRHTALQKRFISYIAQCRMWRIKHEKSVVAPSARKSPARCLMARLWKRLPTSLL